MKVFGIIFRQENHNEYLSGDFYSTKELAEVYLHKNGYTEKNNCNEHIRPIERNGNKTYDEWTHIFTRNVIES